MENKKSKNTLAFTGERMINHPDSDLFKISLARYKFAASLVAGKKVLDISCGSGYGSYYLSKYVESVIGVDIDHETIEYCRANYKENNLFFEVIEKDRKIETFQNKFDAIVSFETIEHIKNYAYFLESLKSYLKKDGIIILSTPNNFEKINPPNNKFHFYEFDILELNEILSKVFTGHEISIFGQIKTNFKRSEKIKKSFIKKILAGVFSKIYSLDRKYLHALVKLEHLPIYKFIGNLQRDCPLDEYVYKIDKNTDFFNPQISIYVGLTHLPSSNRKFRPANQWQEKVYPL